jgi:hypothetical protein
MCTASHIMCMPHAHSHTHVAGGSPDAAGEGGREAWYSRDTLGGGQNNPIQPVHPVPPEMRFANAVAAEPCGSPIDFGSSAQSILCDVMLARAQAHGIDI